MAVRVPSWRERERDVTTSTSYHRSRPPALRRREARHRADDYIAQVSTPTHLSPFEVRIMNISGTGLCLRVSSPLKVHEPISIILKQLMVEGKVQYCVPNEVGTLDVGVEISLVHDRPAGDVKQDA